MKDKKIIFIFIIFIFFIFIFEIFYINKFKNQSHRVIRLKEHYPNFNIKIKIPNRYRNIIPHKIIDFKVDENGFILPHNSYNKPDFEIYFLGGSTTECQFVLPKLRFPFLVGKYLEETTNKKINSFNSGVGGNTSFHNLNILNNKIRFLNSNKKIIVLMNNINDLNTLLSFGNYNNDAIENRMSFNNIFVLLSEHINMVGFIRDIILNILKITCKATHDYKIIPSLINEKKRIEAIGIYKKNIECFIKFCEIYQCTLIIMTQPQIYDFYSKNTWYLGAVKNNKEYYKLFCDMHNNFNNVVKELCQKNNVYLIDLAKKIKNPKLFYDSIHYNDSGSIEIAKFISKKIKENIFNN